MSENIVWRLWRFQVALLFYILTYAIMKTILKYVWIWFLIFSLYLFTKKWELWLISIMIWLLLIPSSLEYIKTFIKNKFKKEFSNIIYFCIAGFLIFGLIWELWSNKTQNVVQNNNTIKNAPEKIISLPGYKILNEEESVIKWLKKYVINVILPWDLITKDDINKVSEKIIADYKSKWWKIIFISFYNSEIETRHSWYTLWFVEFRDWKINYQYKNKLWNKFTDKPTQEEFEIAIKIMDLYYDSQKTWIWLTEEQVYGKLSKELKMPAEKLANIHKKIVFWEMK